LNLLGIDFEDWFHPELIKKNLDKEDPKPTIINGIDKIINLLNKHDTFATFFVVGELLEYKPEILDKILENGHEIGFHTMYHTKLDSTGFETKFEDELIKFKKLTRGKSKGFRAPTFSLNQSSSWTIPILEKNDYLYDSSIVPAKTTMYGIENAEIQPYRISSNNLAKNNSTAKLMEFPLLITKFLGKKIPIGGGFYLRTFPLKITERSISNYEKQNIPATFYIHSWELTPELMPKIKLSKKDSFITYHNLQKTPQRMEKILEKFKFTSFERYIKSNNLL